MATTTNYGWTTPDDTALVKDGASAIRTLGTSVDTTTKNLNPETTLGDIAYRSSTANVNTRLPLGTAGQVLKVNSGATAPEWATDATGMSNPMTTTGDTIYSSSGSTPARLAIGSTGNVLTVAGGVPTWAAPAGGSWSQSASGSLSGATVTVSGLSAKQYFIIWDLISITAAAEEVGIRLNGDTGNNYYRNGFTATTRMVVTLLNTAASQYGLGILIDLADTASQLKPIFQTGSSNNNAEGGTYKSTSAITSLSFSPLSGTFDGGNYYVWSFA